MKIFNVVEEKRKLIERRLSYLRYANDDKMLIPRYYNCFKALVIFCISKSVFYYVIFQLLSRSTYAILEPETTWNLRNECKFK